MKILITGATGAIGQLLLDDLILNAQRVYGITQSKEKSASPFQQRDKARTIGRS